MKTRATDTVANAVHSSGKEKIVTANIFKSEFARPIQGENSLIGREEELQMLSESFYKKRMKNSILIGNAGCGKSTLLKQLAYNLSNRFSFLELDIGASLNETSLRGQFESKMNRFFQEVASHNKKTGVPKIVLYIDEIHNIYGTGGVEGCVSMSNLIKPYLSDGSITVIGATTTEEYELTIKKDKALSRRLSPVFLKDLSDSDTLEILKKFSGGKVAKAILELILEKSKVLKKTQPDISIEILDRCMAKRKFTGDAVSAEMIEKIINYMKENN